MAQAQKIEEGTFQLLEDFEEKQFEEAHFFSQKEIQTVLANFKGISIVPIQSEKEERPHKYWKVIAEKMGKAHLTATLLVTTVYSKKHNF